MHQSQKPVHKCHGCGLNLGDACAVYDNPHEMWHHRKCPGFKNEKMLAEYQAYVAKHPPDSNKEKRRFVAKLRATGEHRDGRGVSPMGSGGKPGKR